MGLEQRLRRKRLQRPGGCGRNPVALRMARQREFYRRGANPQRILFSLIIRNSHDPRIAKLRGGSSRHPGETGQAFQNGFLASRRVSSREIPTSLNCSSSSKPNSRRPCLRLSQISIVRTQFDSLFRPVPASELTRRRSKIDDCDIADIPSRQAGLRRRRGAGIEPGEPCQQSINSLPCPRFSHERSRCPASYRRSTP